MTNDQPKQGTITKVDQQRGRVKVNVQNQAGGTRSTTAQWHRRNAVREVHTAAVPCYKPAHTKVAQREIQNMTTSSATEEAKGWIRERKNDPSALSIQIPGVSDGSVYDHKEGGGYAWGFYGRMSGGSLRKIGIFGVGREECTGLDVHSVRSYRMEALGLLSPLTVLKKLSDGKGKLNGTQTAPG